MKTFIIPFLMLHSVLSSAQTYPPQAGTEGSTAIHKTSPLYVAWATGITVERGYLKKSDPSFTIGGSNRASAGNPSDIPGFPEGTTVSLGDEGSATLTFDMPIIDGDGFDLAVFENGMANYLELAFVEASSDGINFFRFPAHSQTQTATQLGSFGTPLANYLNNLAGKYSSEYGTPFDLAELPDNALLDKNNITHIRVVDVVGIIDPAYATFDSLGNAVNDSYPTPFASCGFDLQAVGVIHQQTLGIKDFSKADIRLYPNPAKDRFYIGMNETSEIKIFDISGRLVRQQTVRQNEAVVVSDLNPGIYFVETGIGKQQTTQKLLIK